MEVNANPRRQRVAEQLMEYLALKEIKGYSTESPQ
jgi:hypothetical protein